MYMYLRVCLCYLERSNPEVKTGLLSIIFFISIPVLLVFSLPVKKEGNYLSNYGTEAYYAEGTGFFNTNVSILRQFELTPNMTHKDYIDNFVSDSIEKEKFVFYVERFFE